MFFKRLTVCTILVFILLYPNGSPNICILFHILLFLNQNIYSYSYLSKKLDPNIFIFFFAKIYQLEFVCSFTGPKISIKCISLCIWELESYLSQTYPGTKNQSYEFN